HEPLGCGCVVRAVETCSVRERRASERREQRDRSSVQAALEEGGATDFRFSVHGRHDVVEKA
ncbi:MAG TPA: hypothetical protein VIH96_08120, partial [Paraburkholderia sp.]